MRTVRGRRPDIFVGLGDIICADDDCAATGRYGNAQVPGTFGPAVDLPTYWAHWRYSRADAGFQRLLEGTDYVGVWDDHEVLNDFGPFTDTGSAPPYTPGVHLMPIGLEAFLDYTPVASAQDAPRRLYRSFRWGKHLELIVLDVRQYRDPNFEADTGPDPKTMLGREQLLWLKNELRTSDATWKVIVSSVPMSIPTGFPATNGRDGWANFDQATGYERELLEILGFMRAHGVRDSVWITTDVHFAEAFRYEPFDDSDFSVYELATGPDEREDLPQPGLRPDARPGTACVLRSAIVRGRDLVVRGKALVQLRRARVDPQRLALDPDHQHGGRHRVRTDADARRAVAGPAEALAMMDPPLSCSVQAV